MRVPGRQTPGLVTLRVSRVNAAKDWYCSISGPRWRKKMTALNNTGSPVSLWAHFYREEAKTTIETLTTFCLEVNAQLSQRPLASLGLDLFTNARDLLIVGDANEVASGVKLIQTIGRAGFNNRSNRRMKRMHIRRWNLSWRAARWSQRLGLNE